MPIKNSVGVRRVGFMSADRQGVVITDVEGCGIYPASEVEGWSEITKEEYLKFKDIFRSKYNPLKDAKSPNVAEKQIQTTFKVMLGQVHYLTGFSYSTIEDLANYLDKSQGKKIRVLNEDGQCKAILNENITQHASYVIKAIDKQ
jgi:hypothetical protein